MKALSVQPFYGCMIATGMKFIELRTWKTNYRGWILICSSKAINKEEMKLFVCGQAVAAAHLTEVREFVDKTDRDDAFLFEDESFEGYSWVFDKIIPIEPIPVKGRQRLFNVEYEPEDLVPIDIDYESDDLPVLITDWWLENGFIKERPFSE